MRRPSKLSEEATRRRKRIIILASVCTLAALTSLISYRLVTLNAQYPNGKVIEFSLGDEVIGGDVTIKTTGLSIYEGEQIYKVIPTYTEVQRNGQTGKLASIDEVRIVVCDITITNNGEEACEVNAGAFGLQGTGWFAITNHRGEYELLNDVRSVRINLEPGEQISVRLPYKIYAFQFTNEYDWDHAIDEIDLILGKYPILIIVHMR